MGTYLRKCPYVKVFKRLDYFFTPRDFKVKEPTTKISNLKTTKI